MRKLSLLLAALLLLSSCFCGCANHEKDPHTPEDTAGGKVYYVSPDGDDSAEGTEEAPFATMAGAKEAIRDLKARNGLPDGGVTVYFMSGIYHVDSTLEFGEEDAGEAGKPVIYKAAPDGEVVFTGGILLNGSDFRPASETIRAQLLDQSAAEHLLEIDLEAAGCTDLADSGWGTDHYRQELYVENKRQTVARWPNDAYAIVSDAEYDEEKGCVSYPIPEEKAACYASLASFRYYGFPLRDWSDIAIEMTPADIDAGRSRMLLRQYSSIRDNASYYVYNILAELDVPGEYYWDVDAKKLYYYPEDSIEGKKIVFSQFDSSWFLMNQTANLEFSGFTFENARSSVFGYTGEAPSSTIKIADCTFRCLGTNAISLKGDHITISGNQIYETGTAGILLYGGDIGQLNYSGDVVFNNCIHDYSQTYNVYHAAINIDGFGFAISHNEIYNAPHEAIAFNCGGTTIEYNYVHDVCRQTSDAGALYSGRRYDWSGNVIRYNYIKDVFCTMFEDYWPCAIYLDDGLSDQTCYGNIIENIAGAPFSVGGGKYNNIYNNIIIDCGFENGYDVRGTDWMRDHVAYKSGGMWQDLIASNYLDRLHRYYFPKNILFIEKNETSCLLNPDDPGTPSYTNICRNVTIGLNEAAFGDYERYYGSTSDNILYESIEDVGFVDGTNGNYNLKENAPVFRDVLGFEAIPFDEIGLLN